MYIYIHICIDPNMRAALSVCRMHTILNSTTFGCFAPNKHSYIYIEHENKKLLPSKNKISSDHVLTCSYIWG